MSDDYCQWCRRVPYLDGHWPSCPTLIEEGCDAYVKEPTKKFPGAISITGLVVEVLPGVGYWVDATVGGLKHPTKHYWFPRALMFFRWGELGVRYGTPISQLSGRPGHGGYNKFKAIAASWGYD